MKVALMLLLSIVTITSCSNVLSNRHKLIKPAFTNNGVNVVYSELVKEYSEPINNKNFIKNNDKSNFYVRIKILRTSSLNSKQIRQSGHNLDAKLKAGIKYQVNTALKDGVLSVWLINKATSEIISTISTIDTVFEKVYTLKDETQSEAYRIKIILNNLKDKIANVSKINKRKPLYTWD